MEDRGRQGIRCIPGDVDCVMMYLTFGALSSLGQERVDGNEGRDEDVVTKAPFSV